MSNLSLGGRPREEGGHKAFNISINAETHKGFEKIHDKGGNRSKLVEEAMRPLISQLDPGESCEVVGKIDRILNSEIVKAVSNYDFEKTATLATIGNSLSPFRSLCRVSGGGETTRTR